MRQLILIALVMVGCGKHYDFLEGPSRMQMTASRMAMVGKPWVAQVLVSGALPEGYSCLLVKVAKEDYGVGCGEMRRRVITLSPIVFSVSLYLRLKGYVPLDAWVVEDPRPYSTDVDRQEEWDETVRVEVELWDAEPHPIVPGEILRKRRLCRSSFDVKLSCPQCLM